MKRFAATACLPLLLTLGACRTAPPGSGYTPELYRVNDGDVLNIEVFNEPDISRTYEVGADGALNHPLLGRVDVLGLTLPEVETRLTRLLERDYLVDPRVSVAIARSTSRPVMIFGEVQNPGACEIPAGRRLTLLQAIAQAGGFTDTAARDRVRIVRLAGGKEETLNVRVSDLLRGRGGVTDIDLRAGDVVTVPETRF